MSYKKAGEFSPKLQISAEVMEILKNRDAEEEDYEALEKQKLKEYKRKQRLDTIPPRFKSSTFSNYEGREEVKDWLKGGRSAIIHGSNGVGKTHLAFASIRQQIESDIDARYILAADYFDMIKETFVPGGNAKSIVQQLANVPYLVIDEVDKVHNTRTEFVYLYRLINERWNLMNNTVVISNAEDRKDLVQFIGSSSIDRLLDDGKRFELKGESWRRK